MPTRGYVDPNDHPPTTVDPRSIVRKPKPMEKCSDWTHRGSDGQLYYVNTNNGLQTTAITLFLSRSNDLYYTKWDDESRRPFNLKAFLAEELYLAWPRDGEALSGKAAAASVQTPEKSNALPFPDRSAMGDPDFRRVYVREVHGVITTTYQNGKTVDLGHMINP